MRTTKNVIAQSIVSLILCTTGATTACAQSNETTSGELEEMCTSTAMLERQVCELIVKAFKDGFIEGTGAGVVGVYGSDPDVLQLFKDTTVKEMAPRISEISRMSACVGRTPYLDIVEAFKTTLREKPSLREEPYRTGLTRTIQYVFCKG